MNQWLIDNELEEAQALFPVGAKIRIAQGGKCFYTPTNQLVDLTGVTGVVTGANLYRNPNDPTDIEILVDIEFDNPPPGFIEKEGSFHPDLLEII